MLSTAELTEKRMLAQIIEEDYDPALYSESDFSIVAHRDLYRELCEVYDNGLSLESLFRNLARKDKRPMINLALSIANEYAKKKCCL